MKSSALVHLIVAQKDTNDRLGDWIDHGGNGEETRTRAFAIWAGSIWNLHAHIVIRWVHCTVYTVQSPARIMCICAEIHGKFVFESYFKMCTTWVWLCREYHFIINWRFCCRQFASWQQQQQQWATQITIIISRKRWMPGVENWETCARQKHWTMCAYGHRKQKMKEDVCLHNCVHDWNPYVKFDIVQV